MSNVKWGHSTALVASALLLVGLTACDDQKEQSLCAVWADEFVTAEAAIDAVDPTTATAAQMLAVVNPGLAAVRHLREVADNRYEDQINTLEFSLEDVQRTLESLDDEADYSIWQPLVKDSADDARDAAAQVSSLIAQSCLPAS